MPLRQIPIDEVIVKPRRRKDMGDISGLATSISEVGLLHAIVVDKDYRLIAGERRFRAVKSLGWTEVPANVVGTLGEATLLLCAERDENTCRKDFTPMEAVAMGEALEKLERPKAKERQTEGQKSGGRGNKKLSDNLAPSLPKTREVVSQSVGMSHATYEKAKVVAKSGDKAAIDLMESTGKVDRAFRELKKKEQHAKLEEIAKRPVKDPKSTTYDVIVIDPPWKMEKIERDVRPNQTSFDYPTMTQAELLAIKPPFAKDCHVWLWTTQKFIRDAFELLDAWGVKYTCTFVWHKPGGFQPVGLPQFNCEFSLYGRKGTPTFKSTKAFPTCFQAARGKHSEKPNEFYGMVINSTSGRRLDMFNRRQIVGFDRWGNEA